MRFGFALCCVCLLAGCPPSSTTPPDASTDVADMAVLTAIDLAVDAASCAPGKTLCGDHCVDNSSDGENCGACGVKCEVSTQCIASRCHTCTDTLLLPGLPSPMSGGFFDSMGAADLDGDGLTDFFATTYNNLTVTFNRGDGLLAAGPRLATGAQNLFEIPIAADLDGDGQPELIVYEGKQLFVFHNLGGGTFAPVETTMLSSDISGIAAADFDGDGRVDLALLERSADPMQQLGSLQILLNTKSGFTALPPSTVGIFPRQLVIVDFDGDGKLDVAVMSIGMGANTGELDVLLGHGDGTFGAAVTLVREVTPNTFLVEDLDDDGRPDIALARTGGIPAVSGITTFLHQSRAAFTSTDYEIGAINGKLAAADLDGDRHADLIVADAQKGNLLVLPGTGGGAFGMPTTYPIGPKSAYADLALADLDSNGRTDIAMLLRDPSSGSVTLLWNRGTGGLHIGDRFPMGEAIQVFAVDLDRDKRVDLVTNATMVGVLVNQGFGKFTGGVADRYLVPYGALSTAIVAADFDGDGDLDLAEGRTKGMVGAPDLVTLALNSGDGYFKVGSDVETGVAQRGRLRAGDLDGDGRADLAIADETGASILLNLGSGKLAPVQHALLGGKCTAAALGDIDLDGKLDLVVAVAAASDGANGSIAILHNLGGAKFATPITLENTAGAATEIEVADVDGDGKPDLVVLTSASQLDGYGTVDIFYGLGADTFEPVTQPLPSSAYESGLALADFDGNGRLDVALTERFSVRLLLQTAPRSFAKPVDLAVQSSGIRPVAGDFDGDGRVDLALPDESRIQLLMNHGGTLNAPISYEAGGSSWSLAAADFNHDGRLDLATGNDGAGLGVMLNLGPYCH